MTAPPMMKWGGRGKERIASLLERSGGGPPGKALAFITEAPRRLRGRSDAKALAFLARLCPCAL